MINPTVPALASAKGIDAALYEIQTKIVVDLQWLNAAYGKAQRLVKMLDRGEYYYPGVYVGAKDYLPVFPDEHLGNFVFFDVQDGETEVYFNQKRATVGAVFWFDFTTVYNDWELRTIENVKHDVEEFFDNVPLKISSIERGPTFERAENIYPGYSHREVQRQFLMRPYGGFRINFDFQFFTKTVC